MEYFEFYNLPISFLVDEKSLKRQFLKKSREFHPDFYTLESKEKQEDILKYSSLNNAAYKVLKDFDLRMKYILTQSGTLQGEGKDKLEQSFLMEMMDINEALMELQFEPNEAESQKILSQIKAFETELKTDVEDFLVKEINSLSADDLESVKQYYLKKKYLNRLEENLSKINLSL